MKTIGVMNSASAFQNELAKRKRIRGKARRRRAVKKIIYTAFVTVCVIIGLWFLFSYFNVVAHNLTDPSKIVSWNFFKVVDGLKLR